MRGQKAQAPETGHEGRPPEQLAQAEPLFRVLVGVDRLAEQGRLGVSPIAEVRELLQDLPCPAAAFAAAGEGDDAERAELVAALDDGDIRLESRAAGDLPELVHGRLDGQLQRRKPGPLSADPLDGRGEGLDLACSQDEVHPGRPIEDLVRFDLRHAAGDADHQFRPLTFSRPEDPEGAVDLGLRLLPDRARVEDHDIRGRSLAGGAQPEPLELTGHALAVENVHLTSPGFHAVGARGRPASPFMPLVCDDWKHRHSRIQPGRAPALRARSGSSARSRSAPSRSRRAVSSSSRFLSQAGLITLSRYWPSSQA